MGDLESMRAYLARAEQAFREHDYDRAVAAAELSQAFAAAVFATAQVPAAEVEVGRHPAQLMPAPRGYMCAAQCGHGIAVHRQHGCDANSCDCPAPFGRIVQPDVPDDVSGLTP